MEELRRFYRDALVERIDALDAARVGALDAEGRATVRRIAHSLRGSGTTYGFPEVTRAAAGVEDAADDTLPDALTRLLAVLRRVAAGDR